jgi:ribonuclease J
MLELVKPRYFMPIHGEIRHLKQHLELALETGVPKERLIYALDGERIAVSKEGTEQLGTVPTGRIPAVGKLLADIDPQTLKERRILSNEGIVVVLINLNDKTGEVETLFELVSSGFLNGSSGDHLFKARKILEETVESLGPQAFKDPDALKESVRKKLKRFFQKTLNKRPLILPVILNG